MLNAVRNSFTVCQDALTRDEGVWVAIDRLDSLSADMDALGAKLDEADARVAVVPTPSALRVRAGDHWPFNTPAGEPFRPKDVEDMRVFAAQLRLSAPQRLTPTARDRLARCEEIGRAASKREAAVAAVRAAVGVEDGAEAALDAMSSERDDLTDALMAMKPCTSEALRAALAALLRAQAFSGEESAESYIAALLDAPVFAAAA